MKRKRRSLKWVGMATCVILLFGWIGTFWSVFGYQARTVAIDLSVGCIEVSVFPKGTPTQGWFAAWQPFEPYWLPRIIRGRVMTARTTHLFVPLWIPLLVVGAPTVLTFRHDRRLGPGYCQTCGYDLNHVSGDTCSECGTPFERDERAL